MDGTGIDKGEGRIEGGGRETGKNQGYLLEDLNFGGEVGDTKDQTQCLSLCYIHSSADFLFLSKSPNCSSWAQIY